VPKFSVTPVPSKSFNSLSLSRFLIQTCHVASFFLFKEADIIKLFIKICLSLKNVKISHLITKNFQKYYKI